MTLPVYTQNRHAFTIHPKGKPVKCYTIGSNGKYKDVQYQIYPLKEEHNAGCIVEFVFCRHDKYLGIKVNNDLVYVKKGDIAVNTRNYGGKTLNLYKEPNKTSAIIYKTNKEFTAPIFNINDNWVYIGFKDENGKKIFGWLEPDMQCGNPFTTCPQCPNTGGRFLSIDPDGKTGGSYYDITDEEEAFNRAYALGNKEKVPPSFYYDQFGEYRPNGGVVYPYNGYEIVHQKFKKKKK